MRITRIETTTVGAGGRTGRCAGPHGRRTTGTYKERSTASSARSRLRSTSWSTWRSGRTRRLTAIAKRLVESVERRRLIYKHAVAAVETACWDILGKSVGLPLHALVGGRVRDSVLGYANGWYRTERTPEAFGAAAEQVVEKGFKALKVDPFGTAQGFIGHHVRAEDSR
jgi:galactonate dehydratase